MLLINVKTCINSADLALITSLMYIINKQFYLNILVAFKSESIYVESKRHLRPLYFFIDILFA